MNDLRLMFFGLFQLKKEEKHSPKSRAKKELVIYPDEIKLLNLISGFSS